MAFGWFFFFLLLIRLLSLWHTPHIYFYRKICYAVWIIIIIFKSNLKQAIFILKKSKNIIALQENSPLNNWYVMQMLHKWEVKLAVQKCLIRNFLLFSRLLYIRIWFCHFVRNFSYWVFLGSCDRITVIFQQNNFKRKNLFQYVTTAILISVSLISLL